MEYVIISDLHIASDNSLSIFHAQTELAAFLRSLKTAPTRLIINGDFLDFLAVPPFPPEEVFSRQAALAKARAIVQTPANGPLWEGFQAFLKLHQDNRIAVLLGNHDVEVAFPDVQNELRGAMAGSGDGGRVEFVTNTVSYPDLHIGGVPVLVEHGFQYDPYNWYNHDHLRAAAGLSTSSAEFVLPYGSRFVYDVLNHLTPEHPFVPLLKPEPGVFWVMQALAPSDAARLVKAGVFGLQPHRLLNRFKMWLRGVMFAPGETTVDRAAGAEALEAQLLNAVCRPEVDDATQRSLQAFLQQDDENVAFGFIGDALQRGQYALLRLALGWLQQDRNAFFDHRNTRGDDFQRGIDDIHQQGYRVAVLGHSHARKMDWLQPSNAAPQEKGLLYLNTGTWADLLDPDLTALQDDDALTNWLGQLKTGHFERALVFTYARLAPAPDGNGLRASLEEWRDGQSLMIQEETVGGQQSAGAVGSRQAAGSGPQAVSVGHQETGNGKRVGSGASLPPAPAPADCFFNGILGDTGGYLNEGLTLADIARRLTGEDDPRHLAELQARNFRDKNPDAGLGWGDSNNLADAGWGIIWGPGTESLRDKLKPLLDLRRGQAGAYFKEMAYRPGLTKDDFLKEHKAGPGPANPKKIPYYLLIVGGPESVPYRFQYQIDVQYAVGRLHFETPDEYARYAASVVAAEEKKIKLPRRAAFFGVQNPDDRATNFSATQLVAPLVESLREKVADWRVESVLAQQATKTQLGRLLGGAETPALLFTASHGMGFRNGNPLQLRHQGALLCQDWPGPINWRKPITEREDFYFSADDISADANLSGLIAFHFACYGAGTPQLDEFSQQLFAEPEQIAPKPFIARLPQRLLGHENGGALAVVGHVERAWGCSFLWGGEGQSEVFEVAMRHLMKGSRVGYALEAFNERYAELATSLTLKLDAVQDGKKADELELAGMWTAHNDARSYTIIGDPAVRLPVRDEG